MNASLLMQIVMIAVAVIIGVSYIEPTIAQIKTIQDSTYAYQLEQKKVDTVTDALDVHLAAINSISNEKVRALETYIPDYVDRIVVMKDIKVITESVGLSVKALSYAGPQEPTAPEQSDEIIEESTDDLAAAKAAVQQGVIPHTFTVSVEATYTQLKQLIDAFAVNSYPLHITNLQLTPNAGGFITAVLTLETYSRLYEPEVSIE